MSQKKSTYAPPYQLTAQNLQLVSNISLAQVSDQVAALLKAFGKGHSLKAADLMQALQLKHTASFRGLYLTPALKLGLIAVSAPDSPRSPTQRYQLTEKGQQA